jgi:hypothetical protein
MIHPEHDAIVAAFRRVGGDGTICHRGAPEGDPTIGYTHVHGPTQPPDRKRCTTHSVCVEKYNGTVALSTPVGKLMGGTKRPYVPIAEHPLGFSHRDSYGRFDHALDAATWREKWPTPEDFARDVIETVKKRLGAW